MLKIYVFLYIKFFDWHVNKIHENFINNNRTNDMNK